MVDLDEVPEGYNLVVEFVSVGGLSFDSESLRVVVEGHAIGRYDFHENTAEGWAPLKMRLWAGQAPTIEIQRANAVSNMSVRVKLTGYLEPDLE